VTATAERWIVRPGRDARLAHIDPDATAGAPGGKDETMEDVRRLRKELRDLQGRLWAENRQALLVVLQAIDAGGKDGTIKHVFKGVNAQGTRVTSFKQPNDDELAHDFLWRVHKVTPAKGEIAIFNRSHYEDVLVVRVHDLVPEKVWRRRYGVINDFEHELSVAGTTIVKFFLHISKQEQAERFRARLERPEKRWKFSRGDLEERKRWDDYQTAFEDAITRTSTEHAPWFVVPADHKWYRTWAVLSVLVDTVKRMDPQFPDPDAGLENVVID
jgi:PPK2 family polyphosphate:nucleotide phosphotransferase